MPCMHQVLRKYNIDENMHMDEEGEDDADKTSKRRSSKQPAGGRVARQQLTGFEGCQHVFSDGQVYPAYQQGRCQAFHSGMVLDVGNCKKWKVKKKFILVLGCALSTE